MYSVQLSMKVTGPDGFDCEYLAMFKNISQVETVDRMALTMAQALAEMPGGRGQPIPVTIDASKRK